jgi:hypothetical protein
MARKQVALSCYRYCQAIPGSVTPRPWPGSMHLTASHANMARAAQHGTCRTTWHVPHNMARAVQHGTWHTTWHVAYNMARGVQHGTCRTTWHVAYNKLRPEMAAAKRQRHTSTAATPFRRAVAARIAMPMAHAAAARARPSQAAVRVHVIGRAGLRQVLALSPRSALARIASRRTRPRRLLPVRMAQCAPFPTAVRCRLCAATGASGSVCGAASVRSVASHAAAAARGRRFHPRAFTLLSLSAPSEAVLDLGPLTAAFARKARAAMALPRRRATTYMSDALMQTIII